MPKTSHNHPKKPYFSSKVIPKSHFHQITIKKILLSSKNHPERLIFHQNHAPKPYFSLKTVPKAMFSTKSKITKSCQSAAAGAERKFKKKNRTITNCIKNRIMPTPKQNPLNDSYYFEKYKMQLINSLIRLR